MRLTTRKPMAVLVKQGQSRNIILRDLHRCKTDRVDIRPNSNRVTPNSNRVTRNSNRVTPNSNRVTPNSNRVTPNSNRVTPNSNRVTPNSNRVTPNSNKVTPSSNRVTQGSSSNRTINGRLVQSLEREIFLHRVYWLYQSYLAGLFTIDSDVGFAHGVDNLYNAAIPFLLRILFF